MYNDTHLKEVYFNKFCGNCIHKNVDERLDPCNECLNEPGIAFSHRPRYFKENKK